MTPITNGPDTATVREPETAQAEVAELATRVVALPHEAPTRTSATSRRVLRLRRCLWWTCHLLLWAITVSLAVVATLRIFYHDGNLYLTWINAFTRYVYLPAYVCLGWAVWQRRWLLAICSVMVVGCHMVWMAPNFLRDRRFDVPVDDAVGTPDAAPATRIMFANVLTTSPEYEPLWKEVAQVNPDVLVLAESSHRCIRSLRQSPLMTAYRGDEQQLRSQMGEVAVFSKLPIKSHAQKWVLGRIVQTVDLQIGSQTLRLIGLHAPRPVFPADNHYADYWQQMVPLLTSEKGPLVNVGDFNATEHSRVYKDLRAAGLRSAHDDQGRGYATTWPNGKWLAPPIRIDHAFLSPEVECWTVREGLGHGSDHKPISLDVKIRKL
jgi:endonuclease/exonuclease/phosphatase (EEP) superfamily protein YafD